MLDKPYTGGARMQTVPGLNAAPILGVAAGDTSPAEE
jgi:hypothetical protein